MIIDNFQGEVILYGFNMVYRDEDGILDQIHHKQICICGIFYEYLKF